MEFLKKSKVGRALCGLVLLVGLFFAIGGVEDLVLEDKVASTKASWNLPVIKISQESWDKMPMGSGGDGEWQTSVLPNLVGLGVREHHGWGAAEFDYIAINAGETEWQYIGHEEAAATVTAFAEANPYEVLGGYVWVLEAIVAILFIGVFINMLPEVIAGPITEQQVDDLQDDKKQVDQKFSKAKDNTGVSPDTTDSPPADTAEDAKAKQAAQNLQDAIQGNTIPATGK